MQTPKPYQLLHGHDKSITCVAIATELDMAVSGSQVSYFSLLGTTYHLQIHMLRSVLRNLKIISCKCNFVWEL